MKALVVRGGGGRIHDDVVATLHLGWSGATICYAEPGPDMREAITRCEPELILLEAHPQEPGWLDLVRDLHARSPAILIVLSHEFNESDLIEAIEAGADDYLAAPISPSVFVARARAALRRASLPAAEAPVRVGALQVNPARYEASLDGEVLELTDTEFRLLLALVSQGDSVARKKALCRTVWGNEGLAEDAVLRKYIQNLRRKLGTTAENSVSIVTVPRVGYRLMVDAPESTQAPDCNSPEAQPNVA